VSDDSPVSSEDSAEIGQLLDAWRDGDVSAFDRVFPLVYGELHRLARGKLRREGQAYSLQPTQLTPTPT
jgi:hypothetical protein